MLDEVERNASRLGYPGWRIWCVSHICKKYAKTSMNAHADVSSEAKIRLYLHPYFVYVNSEVSGEFVLSADS